MEIYNGFKNPKVCEEHSIAVKNAIGAGWAHRAHAKELLELKTAYFKDINEIASVLKDDHL